MVVGPERLVSTWRWEEEAAGRETRVTVEFRARGDRGRPHPRTVRQPRGARAARGGLDGLPGHARHRPRRAVRCGAGESYGAPSSAVHPDPTTREV
jgi:uncharacterized protein YndB with AHSA1/START domain